MNMQVAFLEHLGIDAQRFGARFDQAQSGLRAFFHHVTQLAG